MVFEQSADGVTLFRGLDGSFGAIACNRKIWENLPRSQVYDLSEEEYQQEVEYFQERGRFHEDFLDYNEPR